MKKASHEELEVGININFVWIFLKRDMAGRGKTAMNGRDNNEPRVEAETVTSWKGVSVGDNHYPKRCIVTIEVYKWEVMVSGGEGKILYDFLKFIVYSIHLSSLI